MGTYDLTMKRLTSAFPEDYVRFALKVEQFAVERLEVEEVDKELPALAREVDFVARVSIGEEQAVLLMEFQTAWVAEMPRRMVGYTWRLVERYNLGVYPVVMVLRPGGRLQNEWRMRVLGKEIDRFRFEVIPVWEVEAWEVIAQRLTGVYPLLSFRSIRSPNPLTAIRLSASPKASVDTPGREGGLADETFRRCPRHADAA